MWERSKVWFCSNTDVLRLAFFFFMCDDDEQDALDISGSSKVCG